MMESLLRDGRSNMFIIVVRNKVHHHADDHCHHHHHHHDDPQVRWEGPKCDGSHLPLQPRPLSSRQKQWKLVLSSGFITSVVFIIIVIAIVAAFIIIFIVVVIVITFTVILMIPSSSLQINSI